MGHLKSWAEVKYRFISSFSLFLNGLLLALTAGSFIAGVGDSSKRSGYLQPVILQTDLEVQHSFSYHIRNRNTLPDKTIDLYLLMWDV